MGINSLKKTEEHPTSTKVHYLKGQGYFRPNRLRRGLQDVAAAMRGAHAIEATCNVCLVYSEP